MRDDDGESRPKPPATHVVGADLADISVDELRARIDLLETEILRLKDEIERKQASRAAAGAFFR